jgi:hypothetical protein
VFEFLESNRIPKKTILAILQGYARDAHAPINLRLYKRLVSAYDDMGAILSTWFSNPEFLDSEGRPIPLSIANGSKSFARLLRISRARVNKRVALELLQQSPSTKVASDGTLVALRRVFILTNFRIPRAAFVIERYLDTVKKSASARKSDAVTLLERSSHVSRIDLAAVAPILRSIQGRGTAFIDSIDGEVEGRRLRRVKSRNVGELGVMVFAWTKRGGTAIRKKAAR